LPNQDTTIVDPPRCPPEVAYPRHRAGPPPPKKKKRNPPRGRPAPTSPPSGWLGDGRMALNTMVESGTSGRMEKLAPRQKRHHHTGFTAGGKPSMPNSLPPSHPAVTGRRSRRCRSIATLPRREEKSRPAACRPTDENKTTGRDWAGSSPRGRSKPDWPGEGRSRSWTLLFRRQELAELARRAKRNSTGFGRTARKRDKPPTLRRWGHRSEE